MVTVFFSVFILQAQKLEFINSQNIQADGNKLSKQKIFELMNDNPNALNMYKSGRTFKTLGNISLFGGIGIASIGVLIDAYKEDDTPLSHDNNSNFITPFLIAGGTMIVAAIPLRIIGKKKIQKSVELHNQTLESTSITEQQNTQLSLTTNIYGIGFKCSF